MVRKLSYYTVVLVVLVMCYLTFWQVPSAFCQKVGPDDITAQIRAYKAELAVDSAQVKTRLQLAKVYLQIEAYTEAVDEYHRVIALMEAKAVPGSEEIGHNSDISAAYYGLGWHIPDSKNLKMP